MERAEPVHWRSKPEVSALDQGKPLGLDAKIKISLSFGVLMWEPLQDGYVELRQSEFLGADPVVRKELFS